MSGRQSRKHRAAAMSSARHGNVFKQGASGFMKWWRRLLSAIFPAARRKYDHLIGWWYKRWIKHEARRIAAYNRDPDNKAFAAARKKSMRRHIARMNAHHKEPAK